MYTDKEFILMALIDTIFWSYLLFSVVGNILDSILNTKKITYFDGN